MSQTRRTASMQRSLGVSVAVPAALLLSRSSRKCKTPITTLARSFVKQARITITQDLESGTLSEPETGRVPCFPAQTRALLERALVLRALELLQESAQERKSSVEAVKATEMLHGAAAQQKESGEGRKDDVGGWKGSRRLRGFLE